MITETWWPYIRNMIKRYPYRQQEGCDTQTARREQAAVEAAIADTQKKKDGAARLTVLRAMYWRKYSRKNLEGAAMEAHTSYSTAKRWQNDFFRLVARYMGLD